VPTAADAAKISSARLLAVHQFPYLARALFALQPRPGQRSMAVDEAWRLYIGPEVLNSWTVEQCAAVMVHEVTHLVRDHAGRARSLGVEPGERRRWNLAVDLEVDDDLMDAGLPLPFGGSQPGTFGLQPHQLAESYFRQLSDRAERTCGSGSGGEAAAGEEPGDRDQGLGVVGAMAVRRQVADDVRLAVARGDSVSAGWRRWSESRGRSLDWRYEMAAVVRAATRAPVGRPDYTYARPSRRGAAAWPVILPAQVRITPSVAVVVDTSASMAQSQLDRALRETLAIAEAVSGRRRVTVLSCDTTARVVGRASNAPGQTLAGGGGTDMAAGLEAASRLRPRPDLVVVMTDGHTAWPPQAPAGTRVVVGIVGSGPPAPPWARTVRIAS